MGVFHMLYTYLNRKVIKSFQSEKITSYFHRMFRIALNCPSTVSHLILQLLLQNIESMSVGS